MVIDKGKSKEWRSVNKNRRKNVLNVIKTIARDRSFSVIHFNI